MKCKANNCPLDVEFITAWHEDKKPKWGVCRYHRLADGDEWTDTTYRIKDFLPWIEVLILLRNLNDYPEFRPAVGETVQQWATRLDKNINSAIFRRRQDGGEVFDQCLKILRG